MRVSHDSSALHGGEDGLPLGCSKMALSTPAFRALLNRESNMLSETVIELLARTYFLSDWRLEPLRSLSCWHHRKA